MLFGEDTRLVVATERSETELFEDLSDGEKWRVILPIAAAKNVLITLSQAAFGELAESSRAYLDTLAREVGCYILTAVADDGELRAEPYRGQLQEALAAA